MNVLSQTTRAKFRRDIGSTLSEVLVSLAIMAIGVVSLASIFPISVLRSLQATQLTNAANLRFNAEAIANIKPELYTIAPVWKQDTLYALGDVVVATPLTALKQPAAVFQCVDRGPSPFKSGPLEPTWLFNGNQIIESTGMTWQTILLKNYVIDPLGEVLVESAYRRTTPAATLHYFGNSGLNNPWIAGALQSTASGTISWPGIYAFSGFNVIPAEEVADDIAALQDSWITQADSSKVSYTSGSTSCTLDNLQPPGTPILNPTLKSTRLVLFDDSGKRSYQRPFSDISTLPTINFSAPLPTGFVPTRARIESKERRYSWLLSVRRTFSGTAYIDVVVFFRRTFSGNDETVYPATFISATDYGSDLVSGIAGGNSTLGWPGSDDTQRSWVMIQYNRTTGSPFLKKGGFVTDVDNLRWYRITDIFEADSATVALSKANLPIASINPIPFAGPTYTPDAPAFGANTRFVLIKVDSPILQSGNPPDGTTRIPNGRAMLMRGIVDVYPIRTRMAWEN